MSEESLEQFLEQVNRNEELKATIENQLDSDGNISVDALIALGQRSDVSLHSRIYNDLLS